MKKILSGLLSVAFAIGLSTPAESSSSNWDVYQKTLATYSGSNTALSSLQKSQIRATLDKTPQAEKFICTGIRYFDQPMSVNIMVRKRAKEACAYAKQLNPSLSTWYQNKPTKARSYAGKVLLTVKSTNVLSQEMTLDDYQPALVSSRAQSLMDEYLSTMTTKNEIVIRKGSNVTQEESDLQVARLENSLRFWSQAYQGTAIVIFYTGADADWAAAQLTEAGYDNAQLLQKKNPDGECMGSLSYSSSSNDYFAHCIRPSSSSVRESAVAAHEYAHLPISRAYGAQGIRTPSANPVWANEGGAEFFGMALTPESGGVASNYFYEVHWNMLRSEKVSPDEGLDKTIKSQLATMSSQEVVKMMRDMEIRSALSGQSMYATGKWATELLVAVFGVGVYLDYLESISAQVLWREAFETHFGVDVETFYEKLTPHLQWVGKTYG